MGELKATQRAIKPSDTLLVVDAMTGQEAASLTKAFNEAAELTGDEHGLSAFKPKSRRKKILCLSAICSPPEAAAESVGYGSVISNVCLFQR